MGSVYSVPWNECHQNNDPKGEPFKGTEAHEQEGMMCLYIRSWVGGVLVKKILARAEAVVKLINRNLEQDPGHVDF